MKRRPSVAESEVQFGGFDHIDLRVPSLAAVEGFYAWLLPKLGLTRKTYAYVDPGGDWHAGNQERYNAVEWYEEGVGGRPLFLGVIEDQDMPVVRTRIAFRIASRDEFAAWETALCENGARTIEIEDREHSSSLFFADPVGTRLELVTADRS
jgi:catechol 2,3-dioxygenase-like lactoylglutathione lyase family enzyme